MSYMLACVELIMITSTQSYNCAHIAQDCPLNNLIQTQLQDKNGVKRILVIVGCRGRIEVKAKVPKSNSLPLNYGTVFRIPFCHFSLCPG